jgi:RNA-directed DNA polymerase
MKQNMLFPDCWSRIGFAAQKEDVVFNNLLCHINAETLKEAYDSLSGNKALGVDGVSKKLYGKDLGNKINNLIDRIHKGSFKPQNKREVLIPKADGKTRPIAISCFEDKLVEWVIAKILENIFETVFIRN